jgi:DNA-directed RNA polymerase specialized sigma24 family protein
MAMAPTMKKKQHYVNNQEFLAALINYKDKVAIAEAKGWPKPRVNNYIGGCFLKIATHLSYRPNFINYMYKDDMVCDGIENCIQYIDNFDPQKSKNPFAYFTQIVYYAFLRRIAKEKRQMEIKDKIIEKTGCNEIMHVDADDKGDYNYIKSRIESTSRQMSRSNLWKSE